VSGTQPSAALPTTSPVTPSGVEDDDRAGGRGAARIAIVLRQEYAPCGRRDAEQRKVVARHEADADVVDLGRPRAGRGRHRHAHGGFSGGRHDAGEHLLPRGEIAVHGKGHECRFTAGGGDLDQRARILHRQRLERERVEEGEDRGVGADAERQREDGRRRERGRLPQRPHGVLHVGKEDLQAHAGAHVANRVLHGLAAHRHARGAPGVGIAHPLRREAIPQRVLGGAQLLVQLALDRGLAKQVPVRVDDPGSQRHGGQSASRMRPIASTIRAQFFFSVDSCRWPAAVRR
jgi:hypothetical protein